MLREYLYHTHLNNLIPFVKNNVGFSMFVGSFMILFIAYLLYLRREENK